MIVKRIIMRIAHAGFGLAVALCAVFGLADRAAAATTTTTFTVSATVLASCSVSAGNMSFGSYTPSAASTTTSTINVTCTNGTTYSVLLDGGTVAGSMTARQMKDSAGDLLSYGLYTTSGYTTVWGDGTGGTSKNTGTGNGAAQPYTVYGQVPASQYVAPSTSYQDTINVTVSY
jgi:spore coat protein U-like protein